MRDLTVEIKAQNKELKQKLAESKRELVEFKRAVKEANSASSGKGIGGLSGILESVGLKGKNASGVMGLLTGSLGKVAGALGLAMGAAEGFNKMIESSNTLGDEMERIQMQVGGAVNYVANSLANCDFSNFWQGLQNAIQGGGQLADVLDRINTSLQQLGVKTAQYEVDIARKELQAAALPRGSKERIKLEEEILDLRRQQSIEFKKQSVDNYKAAREMIKTATGFSDAQMDQYKGAIGAYLRGGGDYDKIGEAWKTLQKGKWGNAGISGTTNWGGKGYNKDDEKKQKEALVTIQRYAKETGKSYQDAMNDAHMFYKLQDMSDNKQDSYGTRARKLVQEGLALEQRGLAGQAAIQQRLTMERQRANKQAIKAQKEQEALAKKTYTANAQTIFEMKANVTYLEEKRDKTLPSSEEFQKITNEIKYWKKEIEAIEFDDNTLEGLQAQLKAVNDELSTTKKNTEAFSTLKRVAQGLKDEIEDLSMDDYVFNPKTTREIEGNIARLKKRMSTLEPNTDQWKFYNQEIEELEKMLQKKPEKGSLLDIQSQIDEIQNILLVAPLNISARIKLLDKQEDLQRQLDEKSKGVTITVPRYKRNALGNDLSANYNAASSTISDIQQDYKIGIIGYEDAKAKINEINAVLMKLGLEPIEVNIVSKGAEKTAKTLTNIADTLGMVGDAFGSLGAIAEDPALDVMGIIAGAVANIMLGYAQASTSPAVTGTGWGWLAFAAAGLAEALAAAAAIKSATSGYAGGGVVGGNSYHGDALYARVNSGEMILNSRQQKTLFNAIDEGRIGSGSEGGEVSFVLRGSDLYGSLKNYGHMKSKAGKTIKIG